MLKKRIVPVLLWMGGRLVKTVRFGGFRDVGDPIKSASIYNSQLADEIVILNIEREVRDWKRLAETIAGISEVCFMPVAIGGGITSCEDGAFLIANGADKVVINSAAFRDPALIRRLSDAYGAQAVVVGLDARFDDEEGRHVLYADCGRVKQGVTIEDHVRRAQDAGAGEFFVQSIDRDGTMSGFDIPLLRRVMAATTAPVIGCGGSGNYEHLREAFVETGVSALACGSLFNFSDSNPIRAKAYLGNHGLPFKAV